MLMSKYVCLTLYDLNKFKMSASLKHLLKSIWHYLKPLCGSSMFSLSVCLCHITCLPYWTCVPCSLYVLYYA